MLIFCFAIGGEFICLFNFTGALNAPINNRRWSWTGGTICVRGVPVALKFLLLAQVHESLAIIYLANAIKKPPQLKMVRVVEIMSPLLIPGSNYFLHAVSLSPLVQLSQPALVWDDKGDGRKKENHHCNRETGWDRILSKNVTRLSHEGHNPSKWFFFFLPPPPVLPPCLLCNVIIFLSRGVTFIKDVGAGATSCQSLGWVLEVYLQCGIARGELQCSWTDLLF